MTDTIAVLQRAREIIEGGWCQEDIARDSKGQQCETTNSDAVCFCSLGAIYRAAYELFGRNSDHAYVAERYIEKFVSDHNIVSFNDADGRTKEDVLAVFDRAIKG